MRFSIRISKPKHPLKSVHFIGGWSIFGCSIDINFPIFVPFKYILYIKGSATLQLVTHLPPISIDMSSLHVSFYYLAPFLPSAFNTHQTF